MKKHLLLIAAVICFLPSQIFSQVIEWQNTIGGLNYDFLTSIQQTSDGGYILAGYSGSDISGDKIENCIGFTDYWIVKTDASGTIQWQNTIGGNGTDGLHSIHQTSDGGYILGGSSYSSISGDKTESNYGVYDYWIVKINATGVIQWQNTIGGSDQDELAAIRQTSDGGYIFGGRSKSNISGDKSENCLGYNDFWIVKTNASGTIQWQNTIGGSIGGSGQDELTSILQTSDGGYMLGGFSGSDISGDKTENCIGSHDFWIVKTDATGNIQWQNTIGGFFSDQLTSIQQTTDGGYILAGTSNSAISGDKTENSLGWDYWIVKTNATGVIQWQNTIGGYGDDWLKSIVQTIDGGYILGGESNSNISGDKTESCKGMMDYWVVKTDLLGAIQWQKTIGGNLDDYLCSVNQTTDGGYILGGYSMSNLSGDKNENSNGVQDYWIIKITDNYNSITGKFFVDINSNGTQEPGEPPIINKKVTEFYSGKFGFTRQNGNYSLSLSDSGNFMVAPTPLNYYTFLPITHTGNFTGIYQIDSLNNFAFQPAGVFNDLCITITPLSPFRTGFHASYLIHYENEGNTTLTPTIIFFPDAIVNFVSAIPIPNAVTLDSVIWNFGPLSPFQHGNIVVTVNIPGTPIGTLINSGAHIEPLTGDANTQCNQSYWEVFTTGSYDPNDILVDRDTLWTNEFPNPPFLEYIIRFQNTGNDTAFTVTLVNQIDTNMLEASAIEFVTSSHPVNLMWIPGENNMQFQFDNILLPDSNVNEPASHGFVRYRIKPKSTLVAGDSITNYAAIYFDFNAPVITNTAVTHVVLPTYFNEVSSSDPLVFYPNPANSTLTIETGNLSDSECRLIISDVTGRTVISNHLTSNSTKHDIDISSLSPGIYFVRVQSGERMFRGRIVKN